VSKILFDVLSVGVKLECGHDIPETSDIYGAIPGRKKRRCEYCWKALAFEEQQKLIRNANDRATKIKLKKTMG